MQRDSRTLIRLRPLGGRAKHTPGVCCNNIGIIRIMRARDKQKEYPISRSKLEQHSQGNRPNSKLKETNHPLHGEEKCIEHLYDMFNEEKEYIAHHQEDGPILIYGQIYDIGIHRIYCDSGSSTEVMYDHCFSQLPEQTRKKMKQPVRHLTSFMRHIMWPKWILSILLTLPNQLTQAKNT